MKYKLNPLQQQWIAALRSGEYKQGKRVLKSADNKYCCLGVACELANKEGKLLTAPVLDQGDDRWLFDGEVAVLPDEVLKLFGFYDKTGGFIDPADLFLKNKKYLAGANDNGASFNEISDFVEQNPEVVFKKESLIEVNENH